MDLANLNKHERTLIFVAYIAVLLLLGTVLYRFVLSPEIRHYVSAQDRNKLHQEQNMRSLEHRDALIKEYQALNTKFTTAQELLFTQSDAEDWLEMLPKLSYETGNNITSITPQESRSMLDEVNNSNSQTNTDKTKISLSLKDKASIQEKKTASILAGISEIPVTVSIRGNYSNIINLFDALERFKKLMVISEFNVSKSTVDQNQVETKFMLNLIYTNSNMKPLPIEALPIASQLAKTPDIINKTN